MVMSVQREAFKDFAGRAEEELGDSLERLVLYGSVARGEENQDSDVDIFAVVESTAQKEFLQNLASSMSVEKGVLIIPIVKTAEEYQEMQDTIYAREVMETGEVHV